MWRNITHTGLAGQIFRERTHPLFGYSPAASFAPPTRRYNSPYLALEGYLFFDLTCRTPLHVYTLFMPITKVMEAIMCIFQADVESKVISIGSPGLETTVPGDVQCRGCSTNKDPKFVSPLRQSLLDHQCIAESDICR